MSAWWFKYIFDSRWSTKPIPIGDDMYIYSRDSEGWAIESKGKKTGVYAPFGPIFSKIEFKFYGVIADFWESPFADQRITGEEKSEIEDALKQYFTRRGITFEEVEPDYTPPMACKLLDGDED